MRSTTVDAAKSNRRFKFAVHQICWCSRGKPEEGELHTLGVSTCILPFPPFPPLFSPPWEGLPEGLGNCQLLPTNLETVIS